MSSTSYSSSGSERPRRRGRPSRMRSRGTQTRFSRTRPHPPRRIPRPLALKNHTFVERSGTDFLTITQDGLSSGLFKHFTLRQIPQYSQYCSIFELYNINKVVVEFRYKGIGQQARAVDVTGLQTVNEVNPILYFKVDHNDNNSDTLANMKLSMKTREHQFTNSKPNFTIQLKPAILIEDSNIKGTLGVDYRPKWGQWITTLESEVEYYGLKCYAVASTGAGDSYPGQIEVTYKTYFTMKNNE